MRPFALVLAVALLWAPGHTLTAQGSARIVAIGDIHGSIEGFTAILKAAGLTDASGRWSGGRTQFIQTGDYTDRGAGTRAVLDLLMALEPQARSAGGRAFVVLGNHEVMNLIGDTRDVTPEIFATFADANAEKRRQAAWEDYAKLGAAKVAKGEPVPAVYGQTREVWLAAHPPGYAEYRDAFAPRGKYGAWLRNKPIVTEAGGSIFMHAGIAPENAPVKLDDLNAKVKDEIVKLDKFVDRAIKARLATPTFTLQEIMQVAQNELTIANAIFAAAKAEGKEPDRGKLNVALLLEAQDLMNIETWAVVAPDGPLWYRGFATLPDDPAGGPVAALLAKYGAKRFVTGHTPQQNRSINARFGGRAVLIDTGMLTSVYKGRAAALEIVGDTLTAIYEDGRVPLEVRYQATVWRSPSSSPTVGR
jgi:hypothetical protein